MRTERRSKRSRCRYVLFLHLCLAAALPAYAQQPQWHLLSREEGCFDLEVLVRMERLPRAPVSPEDFAQMMRERGHNVSVGSLPDTPPEMAGSVVEVKIDDARAPVFVREHVCRSIERSH